MKKLAEAILFLLFLFNTTIAADLRFNFWREYKTYNWNQSLNHNSSFGDKFSLEFENSINSTLIKESIFIMGQDRWQENGDIALRLNYDLSPKIKVGSVFDNNLNSLENHKVNKSGYSVFSEWSLWPSLKVKETLGLKTIQRKWQQIDRSDQGLNNEFNLIYDPVILGEKVEVNLKQEDIKFKDIPSLKREFNFSYKKMSASQDSLDIFFKESYSRKGFYSGVDYSQVSTQKRRERTLSFGSIKRIPLKFKLKLTYDFLLNKYSYSTEEDSLFTPLTLQDNSFSSHTLHFDIQRELLDRFILETFYIYSDSDEDYGGEEKDQEMESGELGARLSLMITSRDSLYLKGSVGVSSFYTPRTSPYFSDRDIMTKFAKVEHLHIFSPFLKLRTEAGFNNFHQIYLSEWLSANNSYNETYILSPRLFIQPSPRWKIEQIYSIQANYISYDFEKETESSRNKILRRGSSSTRIVFGFSSRLDFDLGYTYRYEDYGQLLWRDQWVARRSWERRTHRVDFGFSYQIGKKLYIMPNYDYEIKREWDHTSGKRNLSNEFYRDMISLKVDYFTNPVNYIEASFRYRFQRDTPGIKVETSFVNVSLAHQF